MIKRKQLPQLKLIVGVLVLLLGLSSVAVAQNRVTIKVDYKVKVDGPKLTLGDIAVIKGGEPPKIELASINLGRAPLPGYTRVLKQEYIIAALRRAGFTLNNFYYHIPKQVRVTTRYQTLDGQQLAQKVKEYIPQNIDFKSEDIDIKIQQVANKIKLPVGKVRLQVGNLYSRNLLGRQTIPIHIYINGNLARKKYIQAEVKVYQQVLVAKDMIKRHQNLSKDLFKWRKKLVSNRYGNQPFTKLESIQNFRLKRTLNAGQVLTDNVIETPPLVKRRERVKIIAKVNGVRVSTVGIALGSGAKGDIIEVENLNTDKKLMAEVIGKDTVKVIL
ncbi:flagellar basal body P-ring formation chaperone FlgA [Selenihalanaerobacter shriftii]|uniref:Flagella basal body P-ring formation protein FlgA n=1 Tax=Selenihalanaerobacter shriftii TaxID=142842 RepID=A0A1T4KZG0_9FIRM|nr:flagellar basal body P-ring formation chaperone FlgA [Selenihalanaerobacter shriftii]SJZ47763.1 flagella basal body P-ring formation protein FlgA [Selenihalanaerobacter shriftii]